MQKGKSVTVILVCAALVLAGRAVGRIVWRPSNGSVSTHNGNRNIAAHESQENTDPVESEVRDGVVARNSFLTAPLLPIIDAMISAGPGDFLRIYQRVKSLPSVHQNQLIPQLGMCWLESDQDGAEHYAATVEPPDDRLAVRIRNALRRKTVDLVKLDPEAAWAELDRLALKDPHESNERQTRRMILDHIAASDPRRALELSAGKYDQDVFHQIAEADPLLAADLLKETIDPNLHLHVHVAREWAKRDPDAALEWTEKSFGDSYRWLEVLLSIDPSRGLQLAVETENGRALSRGYHEGALRRWIKSDSEAAL